MFIAALNFADDAGNLDRSSRQLKAQALPHDSIDGEPLVEELISAGLFIEYKVLDKMYLHIKNFNVHQKIDKPSKSRLPAYDSSLSTPRAIVEPSPTTRQKNLAEGKGREGNGRDLKNTSGHFAKTEPPEWLTDLQALYPKRAGDTNWRGALKAGNARIREGHSADEFLDGARRYQAYCQLTGKIGTEFVKQASTFLGPDKPFLNPWNPPATKAEALQDSNISNSQEWLNERR